MFLENFKAKVLKTTLGKITLAVIIAVLLFFYFKLFNTTGIVFEDTFLKKDVIGSEKHYIGNSTYGEIHITVKGDIQEQKSIEVIYDLPNNIYEAYTVNFENEPTKRTDFAIIDEEGNSVFEGKYQEDSMFLFEKNGEPYLDDMVRFRVGGRSPYNDEYKVRFSSIVSFARGSNEKIRGNYELLIYAIILFALTIFDMKFPLFFFYLRNFLDVKDPEPSDFYLTMQKISWYAMPILGIILMITALF